MIPRQAASTLQRLAKGFPVLAITGPRQSGKTTIARALFPQKPYVSLENLDERQFALSDPKRFLGRFPDGAVIDEVQRCPDLFSWLQGVVDERQVMGHFVLTGSAQFDLMVGITQSLAGRVGRLELLPLSLQEISQVNAVPDRLSQMLWKGGYPALYDRVVQPNDWFANYMATYIERDVRQIIKVQDLSQFQVFVKMCAARTGQLLNLSSLAADCGISHTTARQWLNVLQTSYLVTLLHGHHRNFGKRLVKAPKLYFLDVGLAAWLLGIRDADSLETHASRGALFETWVVSEYCKNRFNHGEPLDLYFWRDSNGTEVDLILETPSGLKPVEIKSGCTFASDWGRAIHQWVKNAQQDDATIVLKPCVVYGGQTSQDRGSLDLLSWRDMKAL